MSRLLIRLLAMSFIAELCVMSVEPIVRPAGATPPPFYSLSWSDEFNGTALDLSRWSYRTGCRRDGYNVQDAVSLDGNGHLVITTYTDNSFMPAHHNTGFIETKCNYMPLYGYLEASIDFDGSPGMWSSFWMQSPTFGVPINDPRTAGTEIDIVEHRVIASGKNQNDQNVQDKAPSALHWDSYSLSTGKSAGGDLHNGGSDLSNDFHTYGLEWTPDVLRFYYDGVLVWAVLNSSDPDPPSPSGCGAPPCNPGQPQSPWVYGPVSHTNEFILLCSEVLDNGPHLACNGAPPDTGGWCGNIPTNGFGSRMTSNTKMKVDYVRLYQADIVPPASVQSLLVPTPHGQTKLALNWTAPGDDGTGQPCAQYDLRYSTSPINASNFDLVPQIPTGAPHAAGFPECQLVTGLSSCTAYYFAIKSIDEAGNKSGITTTTASTSCQGGSNPKCQQTPDVIVPSSVGNLSVSTGTTTATASWTAPGDDGTSGTASEYDLRYSTSAINTANFGSAARVTTTAPHVAGSPESCVLTGLCSCTTYYFAIKTKDEWSNWSVISNVPSATTSGATCGGIGNSLRPLAPNDEGSMGAGSLSFSTPYPNPARAAASFEISIPGSAQGAELRVGVFDIAGRRVRSLVDRIAAPGRTQIQWNLLDDSGRRVAPALYMVRVDVGHTQKALPIVVLR